MQTFQPLTRGIAQIYQTAPRPQAYDPINQRKKDHNKAVRREDQIVNISILSILTGLGLFSFGFFERFGLFAQDGLQSSWFVC